MGKRRSAGCAHSRPDVHGAGRTALVGGLLLLAALVGLWPASARADTLAYDLSVAGEFSGSGQVSGTLTGGITGFTFTAMTSSGDVSLAYTLADTTFTEWAIDEPGNALIGLTVLARRMLPDDSLGLFGLALQLPGTSVSIPDACASDTVTTAVFCGPFGESSEVVFLLGTLTVTPAPPGEPAPVPAPDSLLAILVGLAGLGLAPLVFPPAVAARGRK